MDKLQGVLAVLKKHHFWILCGLAALVTLVCWYMAAGGLEKEFAAAKGAVDSNYTKLTTVSGKASHPNQKVIDGISAAATELDKRVKEAWRKLYDDQKKTVLVAPAWAKWLDNPKHKPTIDEMDLFLNQFAQAELPQLAKIVDCEWKWEVAGAPGGQAGSARGRSARAPTPPMGAVDASRPAADAEPLSTRPRHKVSWVGGDQARIAATMKWTKPFTVEQARYALEELWVYRALCNAIKDTNRNATGGHDATVKAIQEMLVAYEASAKGFDEDTLQGMYPTLRPPIPDPAPVYTRPIFGTEKKTETEVPVLDLLNNGRYYGPAGKPLNSAEVAALPTADPPLSEYYLMPFRMTLTVDQRRLNDLLLSIRNSKLPLEVRGIRFNQAVAGAAGGGPDTVITDNDKPVEISGVAYLIRSPQEAASDGGGAEGGAP